jgi:hypothetical protein
MWGFIIQKIMAQRRMFSLDIIGSDAFIDMSVSARELYFQLGMRADDDGFVNPKNIMRMIGASNDDLKVLLGKRFLLPFDSGVVVVKHWKINNYIQSDRYKATKYLEEKSTLTIKENGAYTDSIQNVSKMETQVRLGKDSIEESMEQSSPTPTKEFFTNKDKQKEMFNWLVSTGIEESLARTELWEFIKYWKEPNTKGKERWQGQKFFDIKRRIGTWLKNVK